MTARAFGCWPAATNLVTNGGFESSANGWTGRRGNETISRDTSKAKYGVASGSCLCPGLNPGEGLQFPVTAISGASYGVSVWVLGPAAATLQVTFGGGGEGLLVGNVTCNGSWQYVSGVVTPIQVNKFIQIQTTVLQAITFWVDGAQVEKGSIVTPYVETNGATATAWYGRRWQTRAVRNTDRRWGSNAGNLPHNG